MVNNKFQDAYMDLSRRNKHHIKVRTKIENACKISTPIFYNWLKGITPVPHWAKGSIAAIFNMQKEELFPETELEN